MLQIMQKHQNASISAVKEIVFYKYNGRGEISSFIVVHKLKHEKASYSGDEHVLTFIIKLLI